MSYEDRRDVIEDSDYDMIIPEFLMHRVLQGTRWVYSPQ